MSDWDETFGPDPAKATESFLEGGGGDPTGVTSTALVIGRRDTDIEKAAPGEGVAKAHFVDAEAVPPSNVESAEDAQRTHQIFQKAGALAPPYNFHTLVKLFEHSNALRPNIDAYCVNIDGFGHRFEPVIDLEKEEAAFEEVRTAMFFEKLAEADDGTEDNDPGSSIEVTDEEVAERIDAMEHEMKIEKAKLDAFFKFATIDQSFIALRKITRQDLEVQGNGFWEVLRNGNGDVAQFNHVPAFTMRLTHAEKNPIEVEMKVKRTAFTFDTITVWRRFRRFVQVHENRRVFFKEFGDPRTLSALTGKYYDSPEDMKRADGEEGSRVATEVIHFSIPSLRSPYGIPRWVGTMLAVVGSRQAEEVNFLYFENKSVPPLAVLVSGGKLTKEAKSKLETFIENRIKGRKNFHKILIIEAIPAGNQPALDHAASGRMTVELKPLTDAQQKDAHFGQYDERNIDKIGMSFRLPRMLRGDVRDFNRATADAALAYAEAQVFGPERNEFDWKINQMILPAIGIRYWTFTSNGPKTRDPVDLAEIIVEMVKASIFTPAEARELASAIFNRDFAVIDEMWTRIPPELLKAGIGPETDDEDLEGEPGEEGEEGDEGDEDGGSSAGDIADDDARVKEQEDGTHAIVSADGKVLGSYKTREEAVAQLRQLSALFPGAKGADKKKRKALKPGKPKKGRIALGARKRRQEKKLRSFVRQLMKIRADLETAEKAEARRAFEKAHALENGDESAEVEVVKVSLDEFVALGGELDAAE